MKIFSVSPCIFILNVINVIVYIDVDSQSSNFDYLKLNEKIEVENNLEICDSYGYVISAGRN